jgi:hypothetical protein
MTGMPEQIAALVVCDMGHVYRVDHRDQPSLILALVTGQADCLRVAVDQITCRGCQKSACAGCDPFEVTQRVKKGKRHG